jgi:hypothetical protein
MTPPQKPEWMELADSDNEKVPTVKNKRRAFVFGVTALVVAAGGVLVAHSNEDLPASADEQVATQTSQATASATPTSSTTPTMSAQAPATKPSIASLPTNSRGDHEGRGDHNGDHDFAGRDD